jgi:hypothetical protein
MNLLPDSVRTHTIRSLVSLATFWNATSNLREPRLIHVRVDSVIAQSCCQLCLQTIRSTGVIDRGSMPEERNRGVTLEN